MSALRAFAIDLIEGAVLGAAIAALALPDGFADGRAALYVVAFAAIGGVKTAARARVQAFVASRKGGEQ